MVCRVEEAVPEEAGDSLGTQGGAWPLHAGEQWLRPSDAGDEDRDWNGAAGGDGTDINANANAEANADSEPDMKASVAGPEPALLLHARQAAASGSDRGLENLVRLTEEQVDAALRSGMDSPTALQALDALCVATESYIKSRGGADGVAQAVLAATHGSTSELGPNGHG